jgi:hypothetical protein
VATLGAGLGLTDMVGGVHFGGPSWGLGESAGFWEVEKTGIWGAREEVGGPRTEPGLA